MTNIHKDYCDASVLTRECHMLIEDQSMHTKEIMIKFDFK